MSDAEKELREALAIPASITVGGKDLKVRGLLFGEWPDAIGRLAPAVEKAFSQVLDIGAWLMKSGLIRAGERIRLDGATTRALVLRAVPMLATLPDGLRFVQWLAATCTDQPLDFVQKLQADDGVKLCGTVVEVNLDFFVRRLLPLLGTQLSRIPGLPPNAAANEAGSNSPAASPTSSSA